MVDAIDKQIARREATMARLRDELEKLRSVRAIFLDDDPDDSPTLPVDSETASVAASPKVDTITTEVRNAVFTTLSEERPLRRKDIAERVMAMGVYLPGDTPEQQVSYLGGFLRHGVQWNGLVLKSLVRENPRLRGHWTLEGELEASAALPGPSLNHRDESDENLLRHSVDSSNDGLHRAADNKCRQ